MNSALRNPIVGFVCRFALIYALLIIPWYGWNDLYGAYFRALGQMVFGHDGGNRYILFEPQVIEHGFSSLNTRMTLGNRDLQVGGGHFRAETLDMDARSLGWVPTALTIALILATPIPWKRRAGALLAGLLLIQLFILISIQVWIWDESPNLSLITFSPWMKDVMDDLQYTLIVQLGISFSVPVLIWILVAFRREDYATLKFLMEVPVQNTGKRATK